MYLAVCAAQPSDKLVYLHSSTAQGIHGNYHINDTRDDVSL